MTTIIRTTLLFAFALASVLPAAAQSANRTTAGVKAPSGPVAKFVVTGERKVCRDHCAALFANAQMARHASAVERHARGASCSKKMISQRRTGPVWAAGQARPTTAATRAPLP
jgi:hypothetical protein